MAGKTQYTLDANLQLEDGDGAISSDTAGAVGGSAAVLDLGSATATVRGDFVVDVSAIDHTSDDEQHLVCLQGSNDSGFSSGIVNLGILDLSAGGVGYGGADTDPTASTRYVMPVTNEKGGTVYQYVRCFVDVDGTTPSITYKAWLAMPKKD